ncbi:phage tail protein [uncultured Clostridium sp.]|uniref:phage tail protein n=1 Tax=uncultured Clostridium sp. TaxID=59620 RepID=UPI0008218D16|nr:phage tail protein [uncultured Clostridium sp.]SCJ87827.1 Phage-related protein [uncultured Clostridium sp.]
MYQVTIKNENEEVIINSISTDIESPRLISGSINHGINTIDNFTFKIATNNIGYNKLNALTTLVEVLNIKNNNLEFKGRVLLPVESMDSNGIFLKNVTCESELGYLMDSSTVYGDYHNISVRDFLKVIIDNHNSQVDEEKKFEIGNVTVVDNNDSLYRYLGYVKTFEAIKDKLIDRLGGELQIRYENGIRYLDYLESIGEVKSTEIRLAKNLQSIELEKDPTSIISRLLPLGNKLEDSEERLTIESVNNGNKYIDDIEAIEEFGVIVDSVTWDDVTQVSNLLKKGQEYLKENNRIKKKYKVTALDLSTIGLDFDSFEVGNSYPVINPLMNINENLRIIEKTIDIYNPQSSTLGIGDKLEDIKDYQLNNIATAKEVKTVKETVQTTVSALNSVSVELNNTVEILNNTNENMGNLNEVVKANVDATNAIANTLISINNKLDKLTRRINMEV